MGISVAAPVRGDVRRRRLIQKTLCEQWTEDEIDARKQGLAVESRFKLNLIRQEEKDSKKD